MSLVQAGKNDEQVEERELSLVDGAREMSPSLVQVRGEEARRALDGAGGRGGFTRRRVGVRVGQEGIFRLRRWGGRLRQWRARGDGDAVGGPRATGAPVQVQRRDGALVSILELECRVDGREIGAEAVVARGEPAQRVARVPESRMSGVSRGMRLRGSNRDEQTAPKMPADVGEA